MGKPIPKCARNLRDVSSWHWTQEPDRSGQCGPSSKVHSISCAYPERVRMGECHGRGSNQREASRKDAGCGRLPLTVRLRLHRALEAHGTGQLGDRNEEKRLQRKRITRQGCNTTHDGGVKSKAWMGKKKNRKRVEG